MIEEMVDPLNATIDRKLEETFERIEGGLADDIFHWEVFWEGITWVNYMAELNDLLGEYQYVWGYTLLDYLEGRI